MRYENARKEFVLNIKVNVTDRNVVINALERFTEKPAIYCGPPSFKYKVGEYVVLLDGSIECLDFDGNQLMPFMQENGFLQRERNKGQIIVPFQNVRTVVNIINTLFTRGPLINKAFGIRSFYVEEELVNMLRIEKPSSVPEVLECFNLCGRSALRGIRLSANSIEFNGFAFEEGTAEFNTAKTLAEMITHAAKSRKWVKAELLNVINEKYSFRIWLNTIGMVGKEFQMERKLLLKNLDGDISYRLQEQKENYYKTADL